MKGTGKIATIGMFDGVHRGHRALLDRLKTEAAARGCTSTVFTFDRHPLSLIAPDRSPAKLMGVIDKTETLRRCGVDEVTVLPFDEEMRRLTASQFLRMLRDRYGVTALLMGFNHRFGSDRISDFETYAELGRDLGMEIIRADELRDSAASESPICSSSVRRALAEGDVEAARRLLGRPFRLSGKVVSGKRLGRTIGFPTANIEPNEAGLTVPLRGVYAVDVVLPDGQKHRGMLNIGLRPTVDDSDRPRPSIEVHILDWDGDLYGSTIGIDFLRRLRDERRFDSLEALTRQLEDDRRAASVSS